MYIHSGRFLCDLLPIGVKAKDTMDNTDSPYKAKENPTF